MRAVFRRFVGVAVLISVLHLDFETRSTVDLKKYGLDNYARHPTTEAICMAYAFDDGPVEVWGRGQPFPECVHAHVYENMHRGLCVAHNAQFELAIWNQCLQPRLGLQSLVPEQTHCTMVQAYAMALPGALENAAPAVGIKHRKDMAGHRLMLQMCRPRTTEPLTWWNDEEKIERLYAYCKNDVEVERELYKRLMKLSPDEHRLWCLDQRINQRGVYVDRKAVSACIAVAEREAQRLNLEMRRVTGGFVNKHSEVARIKKWMVARGIPDAENDGLAKADILEYLEDPSTPADVREVLKIRQEAGKASTAKLQPMLDAGSAHDGRLRYMFQYHAAGPGRWAGRRVQLHNLVRPKLKPKDVEDCIDKLCAMPPEAAARYLSLFYAPPLDVLSWCLRGMLKAAPGNVLYVADYSNIEGRGLAWLAGEEWKVQAFRDFDAGLGPDLYLVAAGRIYGKEPSAYTKASEERQHGKVAELACGYGGGVGAFQTMAKTYGVKIADDRANEIKTRWREAHPKIVRYWYNLEEAAMNAVLHPGHAFTVRGTSYKVAGSFLWCKLPSGRVICYPYPKILPVMTPWGEMKDSLTYMCVVDQQQRTKGKIIPDDAAHGDWQRVSTYGGKHSENITQAICRDLLAAGMWNVENAGYPVVLHVHDEIVAEVKAGFGNLKEYERLCATMPPWAVGLPVVAKGYCGPRYKKDD